MWSTIHPATVDLLDMASLMDPRFRTTYIADKVEGIKRRAILELKSLLAEKSTPQPGTALHVCREEAEPVAKSKKTLASKKRQCRMPPSQRRTPSKLSCQATWCPLTQTETHLSGGSVMRPTSQDRTILYLCIPTSVPFREGLQQRWEHCNMPRGTHKARVSRKACIPFQKRAKELWFFESNFVFVLLFCTLLFEG